MDSLKKSILILRGLISNPKNTAQEDKEYCGELVILENEYKKLEDELRNIRTGVSTYGTYFGTAK
jgi:hypothetical protein